MYARRSDMSCIYEFFGMCGRSAVIWCVCAGTMVCVGVV